MTYLITLALPCGTRQTVCRLEEASLLIRMGWQFVCMRGRSLNRVSVGKQGWGAVPGNAKGAAFGMDSQG